MRSDSEQRAALRHLTLHAYFEAVDGRRLPDALRLFHEDATFTLFPSNVTHQGRDAIESMFKAIFVKHGHPSRQIVDVCIDAPAGLVAATFDATFRKPDGATLQLHNVNIWRVENGLFRWVKVYISDPSF